MQVGINVQVLGSTVYLHVFERELALLVALQGESIWKEVEGTVSGYVLGKSPSHWAALTLSLGKSAQTRGT